MITKRNFLQKILIAVLALFFVAPVFAESGDIGDFGRWATDGNRELVNAQIVDELNHFGPTETTVSDGYVPIEAKLGLAFMGGMAQIGNTLDSSLVRFALLFMLIAYAFWVAFEAYNLIDSGADAKKATQDILKKGLIIALWLIVLKFGISETFTMIMMPIVSVGTFIATTIWEAISSTAGYSLPNTCDAIKQYAITSSPENLQISANAAAELLCIPTQMSAFFVTIIGIAWKWVIGGVGFSLFTSLLGLYITYLALQCIWKFLFVALGVIADLFLSILLLPFTAIAETTAKTNYKGVAGDIFNSFLEIFKAEKLDTQITRIIKAALYFVCLAVAIGVSVSLLTFIVNPETGQLITSSMGFDGAILLVLSLLLVNYMADKSQTLAESWGGKIDSSMGDKMKKDVSNLWELSKKRFKQVRGLIKK